MQPSKTPKRTRTAKRPSAARQHQPDPNRYSVDYMDHAPVWQSLVFASGLFRPTQNGASTEPVEACFHANILDCRMRYVVRSPEALNISDQAVYFHLCQRIAAGKFIPLPATHDRFAAYRSAIAVNGLWADKSMAVVKLSLSDLAVGIGLTRTGTNSQAVLASLNRLSQATMQRQTLNKDDIVIDTGVGRFLAFLCCDNEVRIVLHFESALMAYKRNGVAWINMREHRSLPSKPARRLHAWLTAWASANSPKLVGLDALMANVWGNVPETPDIRKDRKRTLRKAISEVGRLPGWSCVYTEMGNQLLVRKPGFTGTTAQKGKGAPVPPVAATPAAVTPTHCATTPTHAAPTATKVASTPTAVLREAAPTVDVEELIFGL